MKERIKQLMKQTRTQLLIMACDLASNGNDWEFESYTKRDLATYIAEAGQ